MAESQEQQLATQALTGGISGGAGGIDAGSSATSGDAEGLSGSGNKIFNVGGNPIASQLFQSTGNVLTNPWLIGGVVVGLFLWWKTKR